MTQKTQRKKQKKTCSEEARKCKMTETPKVSMETGKVSENHKETEADDGEESRRLKRSLRHTMRRKETQRDKINAATKTQHEQKVT